MGDGWFPLASEVRKCYLSRMGLAPGLVDTINLEKQRAGLNCSWKMGGMKHVCGMWRRSA